MPRVEILVEEKSIKELLRIILPKVLPQKWQLDENYFIREHEGKSDLKKSIENKVKVFSNWHEPIGLVVVHDQDTADCKLLKEMLVDKCKKGTGDKLTVGMIIDSINGKQVKSAEDAASALKKGVNKVVTRLGGSNRTLALRLE